MEKARHSVCEGLMRQPGWSYTPWERKKGKYNPSFKSWSLCLIKTPLEGGSHLSKKQRRESHSNWPAGPSTSQLKNP